MNVRIESSWQQRLQSEFGKPYFENLAAFVRHEYATKTVYPPGSQIFAAFDACPFDQVKVVILGQDPYINPGQAMGLAFSVPYPVPPPPSLLNIFREIKEETGRIPITSLVKRMGFVSRLMIRFLFPLRFKIFSRRSRAIWESLFLEVEI